MRYLDEMKLARVIEACDGIDGRVRMQKIVYLLIVMGYDLPFDDFTIRQQGPFSRAVACAADLLTSGQVVEETKDELGTSDLGEPIVQYSYRVRPALAPLIRKHFDVDSPSAHSSFDADAKMLKKYERAVLEVAATRVFLDRETRRPGESLESELQRLKGHLSGSFEEAKSLVDKITPTQV